MQKHGHVDMGTYGGMDLLSWVDHTTKFEWCVIRHGCKILVYERE